MGMFQKLAQAHVARKQTQLPCWLHYQVLPWRETPLEDWLVHTVEKNVGLYLPLKPACWESDLPLTTCNTEIVFVVTFLTTRMRSVTCTSSPALEPWEFPLLGSHTNSGSVRMCI